MASTPPPLSCPILSDTFQTHKEDTCSPSPFQDLSGTFLDCTVSSDSHPAYQSLSDMCPLCIADNHLISGRQIQSDMFQCRISDKETRTGFQVRSDMIQENTASRHSSLCRTGMSLESIKDMQSFQALAGIFLQRIWYNQEIWTSPAQSGMYPGSKGYTPVWYVPDPQRTQSLCTLIPSPVWYFPEGQSEQFAEPTAV